MYLFKLSSSVLLELQYLLCQSSVIMGWDQLVTVPKYWQQEPPLKRGKYPDKRRNSNVSQNNSLNYYVWLL